MKIKYFKELRGFLIFTVGFLLLFFVALKFLKGDKDEYDKVVKEEVVISIRSLDILNKQYSKKISVESGDNFLTILLGLSVPQEEIFRILSSIKKIFNPRRLNVGQEIVINYKLNDEKKANIDDISIKIDNESNLVIYKDDNGKFIGKIDKIKLQKEILKYTGIINNSIFVDGTKAGIPAEIMINLINLYSYDIDFQREIRSGNKFEVLFEVYVDTRGKKVKYGKILYSFVDLGNRKIEFYRYKNNFFNKNGEGVKKFLLKTPINGARISSRFGIRTHPILGYSRMHKGVDFAARTGTPILSAGNGVVIFAGRNGGYGNFVKIRHSNSYITAYAHLSRFGKRIKKGRRVEQGDIIGYVGSTGRSTGPHLHYEVLYKKKHINPLNLKIKSSTKLSKKELYNFYKKKDIINDYLINTPNQNKSLVNYFIK